MDGRVTGIGKFLRGNSPKMATRLKILKKYFVNPI